MAVGERRGPGSSHLLLTPAHVGTVVGIDPHKRTLSAAVVDARGGLLASEHFRVSGEGHRALVGWARSFGPIARWGIENAAGWGRHTAVFLTGHGQDVRDVCRPQPAAFSIPHEGVRLSVCDRVTGFGCSWVWCQSGSRSSKWILSAASARVQW